MEDRRLPITIGQGAGARVVTLDLPPFTLIGATTRAGLLTTPLRDRFGIQHRFEPYGVEDLARIVRRSATILDVALDDGGAGAIAARSRGTPRVANRLLKRVRDWAEVRGSGVVDDAAADAALAMLEVDELGLDRLDREILTTICAQFARRAGRPVDAGHRRQRGGRHPRGRLRALPAPARAHPAHAARPGRHPPRLRAPRARAAARDRAVLIGAYHRGRLLAPGGHAPAVCHRCSGIARPVAARAARASALARPAPAAPNGRQARRVGPRRGRTGGGHRGAAGRLRYWLPFAIVAVSVGAAAMGWQASVADERATHHDVVSRQDLVRLSQIKLQKLQTVDAELRTYGEYERYALLAREQARDALSARGERAPSACGPRLPPTRRWRNRSTASCGWPATSRAPVTRTTSRRRLPGPSPATRISRASSRTPGGPRRATSAAGACT